MILGSHPACAAVSFFLSKQPLVPFTLLDLHQRELTRKLLARQPKLDIPASLLFFRRPLSELLERPPIPQHHAARAIIALGDHALNPP